MHRQRLRGVSVLAAGVSKAADVGFIDGVQEGAVSLKHTSKNHTVCLCALLRIKQQVNLQYNLPGSV